MPSYIFAVFSLTDNGENYAFFFNIYIFNTKAPKFTLKYAFKSGHVA